MKPIHVCLAQALKMHPLPDWRYHVSREQVLGQQVQIYSRREVLRQRQEIYRRGEVVIILESLGVRIWDSRGTVRRVEIYRRVGIASGNCIAWLSEFS